MSFKQTDFCYECKEQPENLLSLQCGHDLCLKCSSTQYYRFQYRKKNFICQICGKGTPLDHSSIYELEKLIISHPPEDKYQSNEEERRKQTQGMYDHSILQEQSMNRIDSDYNLQNKSFKQQQQQFQQNQQQPQQQYNNQQQQQQNFQYSQKQQQTYDDLSRYKHSYQNQKDDQQQSYSRVFTVEQILDDRYSDKYDNSRLQEISVLDSNDKICKDHDDEEVKYFCFDCKTNCICPECVIHGVHKDHNVKTIKKSYPIIKQILEDYKIDIDNTIQMIQDKKESIHQNKTEILNIQKNLKLEITTVFNVLKQKVEDTCQQLIQQTEEVTKKSLRDIDDTTKNIDSHIINFKKNEDKINEQLRFKDEYKVLNYYGQNVNIFEDKNAIVNKNNPQLLEQFQNAKSIFSNHIQKKNQFLNIKSSIEDLVLDLQNIEKKFIGQISYQQQQQQQQSQLQQFTSMNEENDLSMVKEQKKILDKQKENLYINDIIKNNVNAAFDKSYQNPVSFLSKKNGFDGNGISKQLDQDFERMKENLKKSSQYRSNSLKKRDDSSDLYLHNYNLKHNKI